MVRARAYVRSRLSLFEPYCKEMTRLRGSKNLLPGSGLIERTVCWVNSCTVEDDRVLGRRAVRRIWYLSILEKILLKNWFEESPHWSQIISIYQYSNIPPVIPAFPRITVAEDSSPHNSWLKWIIDLIQIHRILQTMILYKTRKVGLLLVPVGDCSSGANVWAKDLDPSFLAKF